MPGMRILLIDDDRDFVEATRTVLESAQHRVEAAFNGSTGLEKARAAPPDLIILDVVMPGESGLDVLERMRMESGLAGVPVILLTSLAHGLNAMPAGAAAPARYVEKPVRPAELLRIVGQFAAS